MEILGIDIGGSGIKGAPVETQTGDFTRDRMRLETPDPARPGPVAKAVAQIVHHFAWDGPVGVTFPGVVVDGVTRTAANLTEDWRDLRARDLFAEEGRQGTVLLVTLGPGIGSALFTDGRLVANTELGHIEIRGKDGEKRASAHAREVHEWSWEKWAGKLDEYLRRVEDLVWPSLIIVGGGVSKHAEHFLPHLKEVRTEVVAAQLHNAAGIVGAAMAAVPRGPAG
jgi:polyphosphate glucokinase